MRNFDKNFDNKTASMDLLRNALFKYCTYYRAKVLIERSCKRRPSWIQLRTK